MKIFLLSLVISLSALADLPEQTPTQQTPVQHSQIDFGLVPYSAQRTQVLTLTNQAETPLTNISAKLKSDGSFFMKNNCPQTLTQGQSCQMKLTFWATQQGYHTGKLTVTTSDQNYVIDLSGFAQEDPTAHLPPPPIPQPPFPAF